MKSTMTSASLLLIIASSCIVMLPSAAAADRFRLLDEDVFRFDSSVKLEQRWQSFKEQFEKVYEEVAEEEARKRIFLKNLETIKAHNHLYAKRLKTYTMGINQFTDMEVSEFLKQMTCTRSRDVTYNPKQQGPSLSENDPSLPTYVDWREKGLVTPVKNQRHCGSCWAFSATGALEGQFRRKNGTLVSLSEQNLVDCSSKYGNHGCNGGMMERAFRYIANNGGIDTEASYPYEGMDKTCRFKRDSIGATCKGFERVAGGEKKLQDVVANRGPVSVAIDVESSFMHYKKGVYYEPHSSKTKLNHGVLVVGYGTTNDGTDYWIVKNSWGIAWGDLGYIKMSRNRNNNCGIATDPTIPIV